MPHLPIKCGTYEFSIYLLFKTLGPSTLQYVFIGEKIVVNLSAGGRFRRSLPLAINLFLV